MTPNISDLSTNPDVLFWASEMQRLDAITAVYLLDGAPIHADNTRFWWRFYRK